MRTFAMTVLGLGMWLGGSVSPAAGQSADDEIMEVVDGLFDAMRGADSAAVRVLFHPELERMASSGQSDGTAAVAFGDLDGFIQAVANAEPGAFDERIGKAEIRIDDNLATVFTPYAFYFNGNLSHCGVNVFSIARIDQAWRIVGLVDTRRREGCEEWLK